MTFAKLLRFGSPTVEGPDRTAALKSSTWPFNDPMLFGIPQTEFTGSVRRALWALLGEARTLRAELERTRASLRRAEQAVDRDHLLPVLNRRAFMRELDRQIASSSRYAIPASLAFIDLDGLKAVNDCNGHACGDALLVHFSAILLSALRKSDIVGRLGGDEFGAVLLHTTQDQAQATCVRIAAAAAGTPLIWRDVRIPVRFTVGVVQLVGDIGAEAALAAADAAMYRQRTVRL